MADEEPQKRPVPEKKEEATKPPAPAAPASPEPSSVSARGEPLQKGQPAQTPPASRAVPEGTASPPRTTTPAENARITPQATRAAPGASTGEQTASNPPAPTAPPSPATGAPSAPPTTPKTAPAAAAPIAKAAPAPRPKTMTPEIESLLSAHVQKIQHLEDTDPNIPTIVVDKSIFLDTMRRLKHEFGFEHLALITAVDVKENFEVIYNLWSYSKNRPFEVKVRTPRAEASVPSLCGLWIGANWHEREEWDLMGVRFEGHPDHRRMFLPDSWQGHPLRKDYDLKHEQYVGMDAAGEDVTYQDPREGAW